MKTIPLRNNAIYILYHHAKIFTSPPTKLPELGFLILKRIKFLPNDLVRPYIKYIKK